MTKKALLLIDLQKQQVAENPFDLETKLALWQNAIAACRQKGIPIIFVRHHDQELVYGSAGWQLLDSLAIEAGDKIVDKAFGSAFKETDLDAYLTEQCISSLILAGMATNFCVDTTAKVAFELGYQVTILKGGTTSSYTGPMSGQDMIDYYETLWSWTVATVQTLEDLLDEE